MNLFPLLVPAGNDTEVQFNDGGLFGSDASFNFNNTTKVLDVDGLTITGTIATGLDMSGGTFATAVQNWPADPVIQAAGTQIIKIDDTNENMFFGSNSFQNDDEGDKNIGIGFETGYNNDITGASSFGRFNCYIGYQAGKGGVNATGYQNLAIGYSALTLITSGYQNVALGVAALSSNTTGHSNVAIGRESLKLNVSGTSNTAIGRETLLNNIASANTAIGYQSLVQNTSGGANTGVGNSALANNTEGAGNVGIGNVSGILLTTGSYNVVIGDEAHRYNQTGSSNVVIGRRAGGKGAGAVNNHNNNTIIGTLAGYNITTGGNNIFLGVISGYHQTTNSNLLIIDNQFRNSAAAEITDTLMYGEFNATPASQSLRLNVGNLYLGNPTHSDADGGGLVTQTFIREDGSGTPTSAASIAVSHDGAGADDQLSKMILSVNTGAGLAQALEIGSDLLATFAGDLEVGGDFKINGDFNLGTSSLRSIHMNTDNGGLGFAAGSVYLYGASFFMFGEDRANNPGKLTLRYGGATNGSSGSTEGKFEVFRYQGTSSDQTTLVADINGNVGIGETIPETLLELTHPTPYVTLHNSTQEDSDGGRESRLIFKGEQSGGEETALFQFEASHDGAADDQLGKGIWSVNTGAGLTQALEIGSDLLATFAGEIESPKAKITAIGGYAIALTNNTGVNSVEGQLVEADDTDESSYKTADANALDVIGVVYNAGVADASEVWIVIAGIAEVLLDAGGCVHHDRLISSNTAGSADVANSPAVAVHFQEVGHALETVVGAGLAKAVIHLL